MVAEGFTPVETLFGEHEFATAWPEKHRRVVHDTRFAATGLEPIDSEDSRLYLVRSPWPSIELTTVVTLMFRWLRRNEGVYARDVQAISPAGRVQTRRRIDGDAQLGVIEQFLRQSEQWARAYGRGRVNRTT